MRVEGASNKQKVKNMTEFQGVTTTLNQALTKRGYETLTPVQQAVLDPELNTADLLVSAQTGSGKTVAFGLALAPTLLGEEERFSRTATPLALVIAPTRELALQVTRELEWLYELSGARVASCVGGMDIRTERKALAQGPHIVVGTPGRLCDHIKRGSFDTSTLKAVVLDEADEMLDMGFREELHYILDTAPEGRRTLLFSATVSKPIAAMAKRYQQDARRITTKEEQKQHLDIDYQALTIAPSDRENAIINLLRFHEAKNAIIFCATRSAVNHLTSRLTNRGFSVVALSGELSQNERSHALQALRDGRAQVCVATDVASRGIDLPGLGLVIHADIPQNHEILLHRSGRTGRAGSKGVSALVIPHNWRKRAERLLQAAKIQAKWDKPPSIQDIIQRDHERFLSNPALSEPITEEENAPIAELLERYTPQQVAAALIRMHNTQKPAPEDLLDAGSPEAPRDNRADFVNSVWISLSVGRNSDADPRWLLPMICGGGHITKKQIGAIRIRETETFAELTAECADGFFEAVGARGTLDKNITVTRLDSPPAGAMEESRGGGKRSNRNNRNRNGGGGGHRGKRSSSNGEKRTYDTKPNDRKSRDGKSRDGDARGGKPSGKPNFKKKSKSGGGDKPFSDKPRGDSSKSSRPKTDAPRKPRKPKAPKD